jgi:hypothetical protein
MKECSLGASHAGTHTHTYYTAERQGATQVTQEAHDLCRHGQWNLEFPELFSS